MVLTADIIGFATLASCLLLIIGFVINQGMKHEETRKGIYKRIDQERHYNAQTFLRQDIHDAKYENMVRDVKEIHDDVKKLIGYANGKTKS